MPLWDVTLSMLPKRRETFQIEAETAGGALRALLTRKDAEAFLACKEGDGSGLVTSVFPARKARSKEQGAGSEIKLTPKAAPPRQGDLL